MTTSEEAELAQACAEGRPDALARFEREYLSGIPAALAPMKLGAATVEDIVQRVREKLLVRDEAGHVRLVAYAGQGALRGLVKVTAVRMALTLIRKTRREVAEDDSRLAALPSDSLDPELLVMKTSYREAFTAAFTAAMVRLEPRDRNILRLHLLDGLALAEVAQIYSVNRSTIVRRLARIREELLAETRREMRQRLEVQPDELESIMGLIASRLDVSVARLLGPDASR